MDPTTVIECVGACTVTLVHVISIPPFNLSLEDAGRITAAILFVWCVGALFREVALMIDRKTSTSTDD